MYSVCICFILLELCSVMPTAVSSQGTNDLETEDIHVASSQNSRQGLLSVDKLHYLNVPPVGIVMVYDDFECTFKCLYHPLCVSMNLASEGTLWCELLSSDKYSDPMEYKQNKSSHHYYFETPCFSRPCQNGGICAPKHKNKRSGCLCKNGFTGEYCERVYLIDECATATHNCSADAVCNNTKGLYNCTCKPGHFGDGRTCQADVDECTKAKHNCSADAVCSNTKGSYNCTCKPGYSGDGRTCKDTDECATGRHNCSADAVCNNTKGAYNCTCKPGYSGDGRTCKAAESCKELYDSNVLEKSSVATLLFDSKPIAVFCHVGNFGCGDGGWTPVMKIDGNKDTFHYDSNIWSNKSYYNLPGGMTGFDTEETKLPSYWNTAFSKICLGMKIGNQTKFIVINKQANSLYSLIADGKYRATSLGRNTWKTLIGSQASLQSNCNKEGFNAVGGSLKNSKTRIGFLGNDQGDCHSPDSRIGFGTGGHPDNSNTCGNVATQSSDNGGKRIEAMGYILVQ